jgi:hypothetical protein
MSSIEPGLDLHDWQTRREALQEQLEDAPEEALPDFVALVEEMLQARGYEIREEVTAEGEDDEVVARYRAAKDTSRLAESGDSDPGDVADAINNLNELYDELVVERSAP